MELTLKERAEIAEILSRRANDIASFKHDFTIDSVDKTKPYMPGSVELALTREIERLRALADKIKPAPQE